MASPDGPILLYDGFCPFCSWAVRVVLRADDAGVFRFAPLHGDFAAELIARHPELEAIDSLVLVEEAGSISVRSEAVLRALRRLGGVWSLLRVFAVVPRPVRDWAYDLFANWRYRVFGRYEACPLPPPEVRDRFLS